MEDSKQGGLMQYQCVHQDTGLCESCFKYEQEIASLRKQLEEVKYIDSLHSSECDRLFRERDKTKADRNACLHEVEDLKAQLKQAREEAKEKDKLHWNKSCKLVTKINLLVEMIRNS